MFIANRRGTAAIVALAAFTLLMAGARAYAADGQIESQEAKCASTIGKGASKIAKTIQSNTAKCRDAGNGPGSCPDAGGLSKISDAEAKFTSSVVKTCASTCSQSGAPCIADKTCPPLATTHENCDGGAKGVFMDIADIGFPGPFCNGALGHDIEDGNDLGNCVGILTDQPSQDLITAVYGALNPSSLSSDDAKCLSKISKSAQKFSAAIFKGVNKCRADITSGKVIGNPATCRSDDQKTADKIGKAQAKLEGTIDDCSASITAFDLCGNGTGGTPDAAAAKACLVQAVIEATDTTTLSSERLYASRSLVEAAYPPLRGVCGDGVANQLPNPFQLIGEECDGTDDAACPGQCLPPGDVFQCTCADRGLIRFFADGFTADLDSGWTGTSHDSGVTDKAGYVNEVHNCDCSAFTGATCTGTSGDSVCDLTGFQLPTCSWDPLSATRCDAHGNSNGTDSDSDCNRCDSFNANANSFCTNESQCQPQCYDDVTNLPTGLCPAVNNQGVVTTPCSTNVDCPGWETCKKNGVDCAVLQTGCTCNGPRCDTGQTCRGQCDTSAKCIISPNGAPLPISSGGTPVCVLTTFRDNVTGTRNIVTGEHAVFLQQFSKVHLGVALSVPCPLCGGFCNGPASYALRGNVCEGTCSVTTSTQCRFDSDCPVSETCTTASPQCPGQSCNLSLVCGGGGGPNPETRQASYGAVCRLEAATSDFGTTSNDCQPFSGFNISGSGLAINFYPSTSEAVNLPATLACSAPGFELFKCPCPAAGGLLTQPNDCAGACNAGVNHGQGCGTGAGNITGEFTTCAGGANVGKACDEDADCPTSACSVNPKQCTGGAPGDELKTCSTNADCGGGGTCGDACPGGRCVPLCLQSDDPDAPVNTKNDPEEGLCAAGPNSYHCSGAHNTFRSCTPGIAAAGCSAVCASTCTAGTPSGGSATPCTPGSVCPGGETCCGVCGNAETCEAGSDSKLGNAGDIPGAGTCVADVKNCVVNESAAEGGDIFNGRGDATNVRSVSTYCIGATGNATVNNTAGLGGPGRLRQRGINVVNKNSLP